MLAAGAVAGCQTDGLVGPEPESLTAKPRVVDTPKTLPQREAAKQKSAKPETTTAQGDGGTQVAALRSTREERSSPAPSSAMPADATVIPAQSLFGNWTLGVDDGTRKCRFILGAVPIGTAYSARSGDDCPQSFAAVQSWEIQGDQLILRNQSRGIVGRLQPTGPARFDGQAQDGAAFYLVR